MGIARQTVTAQKSVFITGAQALIEGVLKLPAQLEEISSVLEIAPQLEISQAQTSAGCVSLEGTAVFTVLYIDKKGTIASFEARCSFRHTVEAEKIATGMTALCDARPGDVWFRAADGSSVSVRLGVIIDVCALGNLDYDIVECAEDENAEALADTREISRLEAARTVKSYSQQELRIPQNMPPCQEVLLSRGYAVVKSVNRESERMIVEGEIRVFLIYLSQDKNAPLQYFAETLPFGEIIPEPACSEESTVFASAQLEHIEAVCRPENTDVIDVSAIASLKCCCCGSRKVKVLKDLYIRGSECRLSRQSIDVGVLRRLEAQKKILRMGLQIPATAPEAARTLYTYAIPEITQTQTQKDRILAMGMLHVTLCYTTADAGIKSLQVPVPFETEFGIAGVDEKMQTRLTLNCEYAGTEGAGRELDLKVSLEPTVEEVGSGSMEVVCDAQVTPKEEPEPPKIIVYFADGKETPWDVAKRFGVRKTAIVSEEAPLTQPLPAGKRLILIKES